MRARSTLPVHGESGCPAGTADRTPGATLFAEVIVGKVAVGVPVHRHQKMFRSCGIEIAGQIVCGWIRQSADPLDPLYQLLKQLVLTSKVVGTAFAVSRSYFVSDKCTRIVVLLSHYVSS
jgi:hypothetical protein